MTRSTLTFWSLVLAGLAASADEPASRGPLSPAGEAATFRLADTELTVELVAAEPQIDSPVAVAWDADGRMYVAEMSDYPVGPAPGRIRLLTDRDGDGRYDEATVFADELSFPNSVLCWRGGVFITAAPDLLFLKDTDGDGRADERRVVWTGFAEGNQQLRANGLVCALDNWIYGANGRSDGEIRRPGAPATEAVSIRTRDFRFSPDGQKFEAIAGQSQFGQTRDDWGHRFLSWNTIAVRHALLDPATLAAHPRLVTAAVRDIADPADGGRVYAISPRPKTFNREAVDYYNALCGLSIYRGDALGERYQGNAFVGESLTSLVHRRVLKPDGPTFVSCRGETDREFLASSDSWFHPVNTATGPDGALYLVDFYRRWVEHPQFVAAALRGGVDWREGERHGRIWRIRRGASPGNVNIPHLSNASTADLVAELAHANGWRRDTAQRLLVERAEPSCIALLRNTSLKSPSDLARLHALWTLAGLNGLDEATLLAATADRRPELREQALSLAAARTTRSPELTAAIAAMSNDPSLPVRFRLALSLDALADERRLAIWVALARQADADPWLWLSVSGALDDRSSWPFLKRLVQEEPGWLHAPTPQQAAFLRQIAATLHDLHDIADLLSLVRSSQVFSGHLAMIAGLSQATLADNRSLRQWLAHGGASKAESTQAVRAAVEVARRVATDEQARIFARCDAIRVVGLDDQPSAASLLLDLLSAKQPQEVQAAAAGTLGSVADGETARRMFADWNTYTASTRRAVAAAALRSAEATRMLVESLEQGEVSALELDPGLRDALASIRDASLAERAKKVLLAAAPADRQEVVAQYQAALARSGDRRRGAALFRQNCLACHALHGLGHRVGADLSGISARPKATLLEDVLDPNRQITPNFMSYTVVTEDGQILTGLLAAESAQAVTLRRADGVEETVARGRIEQLRASGKSLMPDGFEQKLDLPAMADLLEFLAQPSRELLEAGGPAS
ncbi:MAG TPA: PVC-type heme-binding CxxCH protein [Pirellulales bacterium]|jgi:putative membrane-bound dehydrogenase-like protein|nr:PVC-type heme-binding CxxCH protein [Pirellulales bacterium]